MSIGESAPIKSEHSEKDLLDLLDLLDGYVWSNNHEFPRSMPIDPRSRYLEW